MKDFFNNRKVRYLAFLANIVLFALIVYKVLSFNLAHTEFSHFTMTDKQFYAVSILFLFFALTIYGMIGNRAIYITTVIAGLIYVVFSPYYSPIDEGAHFYYINYLIEFHRIPTLKTIIDQNLLSSVTHSFVPGGYLNEAFQPPLYYIAAGIFSLLIPGGLKVKFFTVRIFGLICLLVSVYFIEKLYNYLVDEGIIPRNDFLFFSICILFNLMPGLLSRMTTIGNDHLIVALGSATIYFLAKFLISEKLNQVSSSIILAALTAAMFLTKIYGVIFVPVILGLLLMKKYFKQIVCYLVASGVFVSPWLIFNLVTYGHLTSNAETNELVRQITNTSVVKIGITDVLNTFQFMFGTFWNAQEFYGALREPNLLITNFLSVTLIISIAVCLKYLIFNIKKINTEYLINYILIAPIIFGFAFIILGSIYNSANAMIGRYVFYNIGAFVLMFYIFINKFINGHKIFIGVVSLLLVSLLFTNYLVFNLTNFRSRDFFNPNRQKPTSMNTQTSHLDNIRYKGNNV